MRKIADYEPFCTKNQRKDPIFGKRYLCWQGKPHQHNKEADCKHKHVNQQVLPKRNVKKSEFMEYRHVRAFPVAQKECVSSLK